MGFGKGPEMGAQKNTWHIRMGQTRSNANQMAKWSRLRLRRSNAHPIFRPMTNDDGKRMTTMTKSRQTEGRTNGHTDKRTSSNGRRVVQPRHTGKRVTSLSEQKILFFSYIYIDKITGNRILYFWVSSLSQFSLSPVAECKILSVHPWIFFCFFVFLFLVDATERKGEPSNFLIATHSKAEMTEKQELPA